MTTLVSDYVSKHGCHRGFGGHRLSVDVAEETTQSIQTRLEIEGHSSIDSSMFSSCNSDFFSRFIDNEVEENRTCRLDRYFDIYQSLNVIKAKNMTHRATSCRFHLHHQAVLVASCTYLLFEGT